MGTDAQGSTRMSAGSRPAALLARWRRMKDRRATTPRRRLRTARSRILNRKTRNANDLGSVRTVAIAETRRGRGHPALIR